MISDLEELNEMYGQGAWSRGDYFVKVTLLALEFGLDALIQEIPENLRDEFVRWLRDNYDNEFNFDEFVSIGIPLDSSRERIEMIRRWIRLNPSR